MWKSPSSLLVSSNRKKYQLSSIEIPSLDNQIYTKMGEKWTLCIHICYLWNTKSLRYQEILLKMYNWNPIMKICIWKLRSCVPNYSPSSHISDIDLPSTQLFTALLNSFRSFVEKSKMISCWWWNQCSLIRGKRGKSAGGKNNSVLFLLNSKISDNLILGK